MSNTEFTAELKRVAQLLENLSQFPQWEHLCLEAQDDGEMTLADATSAIDYALCYAGEMTSLTQVVHTLGL